MSEVIIKKNIEKDPFAERKSHFMEVLAQSGVGLLYNRPYVVPERLKQTDSPYFPFCVDSVVFLT